MKHCIIVKFKSEAGDRAALLRRIRALFDGGEAVPGVRSYSFRENCVQRPNRYDLMIELDMEPEALESWDVSQLHRDWKTQFGGCIESKAIFDYEEASI